MMRFRIKSARCICTASSPDQEDYGGAESVRPGRTGPEIPALLDPAIVPSSVRVAPKSPMATEGGRDGQGIILPDAKTKWRIHRAGKHYLSKTSVLSNARSPPPNQPTPRKGGGIPSIMRLFGTPTPFYAAILGSKWRPPKPFRRTARCRNYRLHIADKGTGHANVRPIAVVYRAIRQNKSP